MRVWLSGVAAAILCLGVFGCSSLLPAVNVKAEGPPMPPPVLGAFGNDPPVETVADWTDRRAPLLRAALLERAYGALPPDRPARLLGRTELSLQEPKAHIEQWSVAVTDEAEPMRFNLAIVLPKDATGPVPVIVMQNFCGNRTAFPGRPQAVAGPLVATFGGCDNALMDPIVETIFGRHIAVPPYEKILSRGYALAMFYAADLVADDATLAGPQLQKIGAGGAIGVWAWAYSRALDVLAADPRFDASRIAIWGHSRNGKAALLAAAFDPRIAAVIAHQSGRGGAALNASDAGEPREQMMESYPHWFPAAYGKIDSSDGFDQHHMLALIAPRSVFLGNSRRDAWADPVGAFRAAQAAHPVYALFGTEGLKQTSMTEFDPSAALSFYMRGGLHGVTGGDWTAFLDFLDAHLNTPVSRVEPGGSAP